MIYSLSIPLAVSLLTSSFPFCLFLSFFPRVFLDSLGNASQYSHDGSDSFSLGPVLLGMPYKNPL